jgi:hypothetical protein
MPQIRNPVDRINVMAGELLQYQVRYWIFSFLDVSHRRDATRLAVQQIWFELAGFRKE